MKVYSLNDLSLNDCHCPQRVAAQRANEFFYVPLHHGYVWADGVEDAPPRFTKGLRGKPVIFVNCSFCGGSLDDRGEAGW